MIEDDIAAALKDLDHRFNRTEIAYLMAVAYRWGYEHRVDEENRCWPPPKVRAFGAWFDQAAYRQDCDNAARKPWPTDDQGRRRG